MYKKSPCCSILPDGQHEETAQIRKDSAKSIMALPLLKVNPSKIPLPRPL